MPPIAAGEQQTGGGDQRGVVLAAADLSNLVVVGDRGQQVRLVRLELVGAQPELAVEALPEGVGFASLSYHQCVVAAARYLCHLQPEQE